MVDAYSYKTKQYGAMCTITVHGIIFLILLLQIHTPIPPYPEGGGGSGSGIELNLGFSDAGSGSNPLEVMASPETAKPISVTKPQEDNEKLLTQDVEDAPAIKEQAVETKKVKKEVKKTVAVSPKNTETKEVQKSQQVVNEKALYRPSKNQTSADGNTNVKGDQGNPNGSLGAKAFGGQGGKEGSGGGTGGGIGTGIGKGIGPGVSHNLEDRVISLPVPEYKTQVEGDVVVEVTVDRSGKVVKAIPGVKGSTTLDENLLAEAETAAKRGSFKSKPDAKEEFVRGTITYKFRLH